MVGAGRGTLGGPFGTGATQSGGRCWAVAGQTWTAVSKIKRGGLLSCQTRGRKKNKYNPIL